MGGASPVASPQWAKRRHGLATALIIIVRAKPSGRAPQSGVPLLSFASSGTQASGHFTGMHGLAAVLIRAVRGKTGPQLCCDHWAESGYPRGRSAPQGRVSLLAQRRYPVDRFLIVDAGSDDRRPVRRDGERCDQGNRARDVRAQAIQLGLKRLQASLCRPDKTLSRCGSPDTPCSGLILWQCFLHTSTLECG